MIAIKKALQSCSTHNRRIYLAMIGKLFGFEKGFEMVNYKLPSISLLFLSGNYTIKLLVIIKDELQKKLTLSL